LAHAASFAQPAGQTWPFAAFVWHVPETQNGDGDAWQSLSETQFVRHAAVPHTYGLHAAVVAVGHDPPLQYDARVSILELQLGPLHCPVG
jgi:hypothetical protein